jgi:multidrug transporter EmrE-like cation transporter
MQSVAFGFEYKLWVTAMGYVYIFTTVLVTVYAQIVMKWRVSRFGSLPATLLGKIEYFAHLLTDYWVISCFIAAFIAALSWMAALSKFEVTYAYPFTSLGFVLVLMLGAFFFGEALTITKVAGIVLIIAGILVGSR